MNPFDYIRDRNVDYFKEVSLEILLNSRDEKGDSLLSRAVMQQDLNCAKVIYERCPSLLYCESTESKYNALHHATSRTDLEILRFLINADAESQGRGVKKRLTRMHDVYGHAAFSIAIEFGKPAEVVKLLYAADPEFIPSADTADKTPLKSCMSNPKGKELFKLLLEIAPIQSKTPMGPNGWTVLHYAASNGDLSSLVDILRFCPDCSEVVDNKGQNFLHIAAQHEQLEVVRFCVVEKKDIASNVLNGQDNDGNTPLSIAASTENEAITLCLLSDPRVNFKLAAMSRLLHLVVKRSNMQMIRIMSDADPDLLKGIEEDVLRNSIDGDGESILSKAVQENDLYLCKMICNRCPSLVYHQSRNGKTPLHHAARRGDAKIVDLLISAGVVANFGNKQDIEGQVDINPNMKLLIMVDELGDTALHIAVLNHKLEATKLLIEADPDIAYNANSSVETPLSIAIREAQSHENRLNTGKIRKLLLEMQPSQSKARKGENGWTLLHFAASHDDLSAVMDIIKFCPDCLELVDNEGMNFFHVAAKSKSIQVVKHVLGGRKIPYNVLNMQDNNGNTPLHIAALSGDESLTLCFLYDSNVDKTTVNKDGQHVLQAINFNYDKRKAGVRGVMDQVDQNDLKDQSDFDLVVGALIATVSFTVGITVPGGYISEGPNQGTAVLSKKEAFEAFLILNTFALLFSLYAVFSHYCTRRLVKTEDILHQLKVATFCTLGALYAMMAAFIAGSFAVLANSTRVAIPRKLGVNLRTGVWTLVHCIIGKHFSYVSYFSSLDRFSVFPNLYKPVYCV